ncbi:DHHC palmitoyltransferase-domain-containing protein [Radiomyces spectabilis]|uniref:DHHC palmitoyltransferase-domain-containing protein n=1 Tax=Radiomyces spectabilis TaxID=64574 RepID=UPI00221FAB1F|nr:DHHC palmitoyltransferase-domain-containing protein [Radiomyces spectabilis]KAI8391828.1 DHHC palmitoyltransferase-domain-containing protein [Radiomyces spectabilis]
MEEQEGHKTENGQEKPFSLFGKPQWCSTCELWRPDRTHHCRACNVCVLKMDQVNGCVGLDNHRYFIQFICYTSMLGTWVFCTTLAAVVRQGLVRC